MAVGEHIKQFAIYRGILQCVDKRRINTIVGFERAATSAASGIVLLKPIIATSRPGRTT